MEFVVLLVSALAITLTQVNARPADTEEHTKDGKDANTEFKFKLPMTMQHNFGIIIEGILNVSHLNFAATLLTEDDNSRPCKLNFNYRKNEIFNISPEPSSEKVENAQYSIIGIDTLRDPPFTLTMMAKDTHGNKSFEITFEEHRSWSGPSPAMRCKVDRFDTLSAIHFMEGVGKINNILFTFN